MEVESKARSHLEFICRMKGYIPRSAFIKKTINAVANHFSVVPVKLDIDALTRDIEFVPTTRILTKQELEEACPSSVPLETSLSLDS